MPEIPALPKPLPSSLDVEQALLATVMTYNQTLAMVAAIVAPEDFFEPLHARIFSIIQAQIGEGRLCSPLTLLSVFRDDETIKGLAEPSVFFARMARIAEVPGAAVYLAQMVKDDAVRRMIAMTCDDYAERARRPAIGETGADIANELLETTAKISATAQSGQQSCFRLAETASVVTSMVNDRFRDGIAPKNIVFPGSHDLERVIGGWKRKRLYIIGGRPSMGKTTVGLSWLLKTAAKGHGVAFFSLEMEAEELTARALTDLAWSREMRIEYDQLDRGSIEGWQVERLCQAEQRLAGYPLFIDHRASLTLAEVRSRTQQLAYRLQAEGKRLDVVAVDHLGLIKASDQYYGNKTAETEEISAGLKALAKDLDIAVVALVQLNRGVEGRGNKRPNMADLRWSGAIEQDADCVMFCYREAYYLEREKGDDEADELQRLGRLEQVRNVLEVAIAKHRGGKTPVLEFYTDIGCGAVRDLKG